MARGREGGREGGEGFVVVGCVGWEEKGREEEEEKKRTVEHIAGDAHKHRSHCVNTKQEWQQKSDYSTMIFFYLLKTSEISIVGR